MQKTEAASLHFSSKQGHFFERASEIHYFYTSNATVPGTYVLTTSTKTAKFWRGIDFVFLLLVHRGWFVSAVSMPPCFSLYKPRGLCSGIMLRSPPPPPPPSPPPLIPWGRITKLPSVPFTYIHEWNYYLRGIPLGRGRGGVHNYYWYQNEGSIFPLSELLFFTPGDLNRPPPPLLLYCATES